MIVWLDKKYSPTHDMIDITREIQIMPETSTVPKNPMW